MMQFLGRSWLTNCALFGLGIVVSYYRLWPWLVPAVALILVMGRVFSRYCNEFFIACLFLLLGSGYYAFHQPDTVISAPQAVQVRWAGRVDGYPRVQDNRTSFPITTTSEDAHQQHFQVACNFPVRVMPGDDVILTGTPKLPAGPGNPGEFDYPRYLRNQHIFYLLQVESSGDMQVISCQNVLTQFANHLRIAVEERTGHLLAPEEAALVLGMLLGKVDMMDASVYQDFQKTGLVHIFAVSGLNVGFIVLFVAALAGLFHFSHRMAFYTTVSSILLYSSLTGWPVSVQRAVIMALLSLVAIYMGRSNRPLNSLGLAGLIILIMEPCALFGVSFQLSFLATWGLVQLYPAVKQYLGYKSLWWDLFWIPVCAQAAVFPLIAYYYNLITPISIFSNILVTYLAGGIVILGFLALLCAAPMPGLAALFLYPAGALSQLILYTAALCKKAPLGWLVVATPHPIIVAAFFGSLIWLLLWLDKKSDGRRPVIPLTVMGLIIILLAIPPWLYTTGQIQVTFIDAGQGDSILIKSPRNRFVLVDGGGSLFSETGRRKVLPFLKHLGVNRLDVVINTHPDVDHIKGLVEVMADENVETVGLAGVFKDNPDSAPLLEAARSQNARIIALQAGQEFNLDGMVLSVWYPMKNASQTSANNDNSLVLQCRYGSFTALLAGDLNEANLTPLMIRHKGEPLTVAKIPHHGSRYSLCPLLYREAHWLVLSVGANNPFGHPHQEVLQSVQKEKKPLFRTDQQGAISFTSDGNWVEVKTFK